MNSHAFPQREHAVVIGAGLAGLLAARVLSDHFTTVTLIERDSLSVRPGPRKGVPQGNHVHGLLAKGQDIFAHLFPDLVPALTAGGAVPVDMGADFRWHHFDTWKVRFDSGIRGMLFTRPFLESAIADRVRALANVRVVKAAVDQLSFDTDRKLVTGVHLRPQDSGAVRIAADLVIDASGRGSQTPQWLEGIGYPRPAESMVKVNVTYASRLYRPAPRHSNVKAMMVYARPPGKTMGALFAVEGNRWLVTLGGFHGVHAPADEAGYLAYARDLPVPEIHEALLDAEPLTPVTTYRFPTSLRRHYERMASFPEGLLVMGDAVCSFNPIYGQGMTVSALEAMELDGFLRADSSRAIYGFSSHFQKSVAALVDVPWQLTTGEDFRHAETIGQRPPGAAFVQWYTGRLHERCGRDASLALAFYRVMHMLESPMSLFRPSVAARVVLGRAAASPDRSVRFGAQSSQPIPDAP